MPTKDTFYFSHDYNARNDEKILEIRSLYGPEGYGVFWMIVETMAENENGKLNTSLIAGLSLSYGLAIDRLSDIISSCISTDLFKRDGIYIYSDRLLSHKDFRKERSESGKKGAIKKWNTQREKKVEFKKMVDFFGNKCVRCEGESGLINVEKDHIIPTYQGGIDDPTNYQPLCAKCNASKGSETKDWRIVFCDKHGLAMPNEWLSYNQPLAKNGKGKERKGKEIIHK
jgi:5-methylcytosine-specific restriction endonuclease McrA